MNLKTYDEMNAEQQLAYRMGRADALNDPAEILSAARPLADLEAAARAFAERLFWLVKHGHLNRYPIVEADAWGGSEALRVARVFAQEAVDAALGADDE